MAITTGKRILKNSLSVIAGNFLNKALSIAILLSLTSYLSPASFGRYTFVIAYTAFFGIFTDLGLNTFLTKEISSGSIKPSTGFGHAIVLRFLVTAATTAILLLSLLLMGYPADILWLAAASSIALFLSFRGLFFRTVFNIPFQVHLKMGYPAVINFLNELLTLVVVLWLIARSATLFSIILGMALVNLPGFVVLAFYSTRLVRPKIEFDIEAWWRILKGSLPLGAAIFMEGVFIIIPVFVLSLFSSDEAIGFFGLPFRLVSSLWIIPVAVMMSLLPRMSLDAVTTKASVSQGFSKGLKLMLLAGLPAVLVTDYFSLPIITVLAGDGYSAAAPVLSIMIWGTFMYFINTVFFYTFTAAGRQGLNTVVWSIISLASVLICVILIPPYGVTGAAVGFVAPLAIGVLVNLLLARRVFTMNVVPVLSRFLLSGLLALIIVTVLPFNRLASLPVGLGVYVVTLLYQGTISLREWNEWLGPEKVESKKTF
ncbi:MAG: flippase [Thermodesulfobacteriota bacterium]|nr:MAG: flippase [Thermodesulfobacteriota bacterium]